jgi:hypothetical protein
MSSLRSILLVTAALCVVTPPAVSLGAPAPPGPPATLPGGPPAPPSGADSPQTVPVAPSGPRLPGPAARTADLVASYGVYCVGQSRRRSGRRRASPHSICLRAMGRLATQPGVTPRVACTGETRRHVRGRRQTPYVACTIGGAQLLADRRSAR